MSGMTKPILVVTSRYTKEIEDRIERDYIARRNANQFPFSQQELLSAAEGADAMFITPADRLDSSFFQKVSPTVKIIATYSVVLSISIWKPPLAGKFRSPIPLGSTMKQRPTSPCCFCSVLRVALTKLRNWFEQEGGSP
jgi:hypothetical protein